MLLPEKKFLTRLLIILAAIASVIILTYMFVTYSSSLRTSTQIENDTKLFLDFVKEGKLDDSKKLWSSVYTYQKDNELFLNDFSLTLNSVYLSYFNETYLNKNKKMNLYEIARIYHDFLSPNLFIEVTEIVYNSFYIEKISYKEFLAALNDFDAISKYTNPIIDIIYENASFINNSRLHYNNAVTLAKDEYFAKAIEEMQQVVPEDTIYYPKSLEMIDEYIIKLKEQVKNAS